MNKILLTAVMFLSLNLVGAAVAAAPASHATAMSHAAAAPATPDPAANPVLAHVLKMGVKLYYMGNRYGMDGWFVVKDGQVQIAYATPDNKGAVIGAMFGQDGENVSSLQVNSLAQSNKDVGDLIALIKKEQIAMATVGSVPDAGQKTAADGLPSTPLSPGERLIRDLGGAASVIVGNPATPEILMVMDPHCPHCQATWKALRSFVMQGKLHLRMIPIGAKDSDNERAAAVLLAATDPLNTWDKYVGGDYAMLVGSPTPAALAAVRANHALIDSWHIEDTPYLVYRGKDGTVKVVLGEPEKLPLITADLGL